MPMTAPGTPVAAGAFAISSKPRQDQLRPVPHDAAGHPERADLCSIRQWHPSSERSKYSALCAGALSCRPAGMSGHGEYSSQPDLLSAQKPCHVGGVGVQGCPGLGV